MSSVTSAIGSPAELIFLGFDNTKHHLIVNLTQIKLATHVEFNYDEYFKTDI